MMVTAAVGLCYLSYLSLSLSVSLVLSHSLTILLVEGRNKGRNRKCLVAQQGVKGSADTVSFRHTFYAKEVDNTNGAMCM